jgi:hypothetical protein
MASLEARQQIKVSEAAITALQHGLKRTIQVPSAAPLFHAARFNPTLCDNICHILPPKIYFARSPALSLLCTSCQTPQSLDKERKAREELERSVEVLRFQQDSDQVSGCAILPFRAL